MAKKDVKPIEYDVGMFDIFSCNPNLDGWNDDGFPEVMWGLGYDMDSHESFEEYMEKNPLKVKPPKNEREKKRIDLYFLEHAPRQVVGNFLFSYWRYLTHWAWSYDQYDVDFLCRVIKILEEKCRKDGLGYKDIKNDGQVLMN